MTRCTKDILRGVEIILSVQPDADFSADHDVIYFGAYIPEDFTQEQLTELRKLVWFEQFGWWATFV